MALFILKGVREPSADIEQQLYLRRDSPDYVDFRRIMWVSSD